MFMLKMSKPGHTCWSLMAKDETVGVSFGGHSFSGLQCNECHLNFSMVFAGGRPESAPYVKCDYSTEPQFKRQHVDKILTSLFPKTLVLSHGTWRA